MIATEVGLSAKGEGVRCWKCGTACVDDPGIGPYCPSSSCNVLDAVGLSPEEFAARAALHGWGPARPRALADDDMRGLEGMAADAAQRGLVLMVKRLRPKGQGDGG